MHARSPLHLLILVFIYTPNRNAPGAVKMASEVAVPVAMVLHPSFVTSALPPSLKRRRSAIVSVRSDVQPTAPSRPPGVPLRKSRTPASPRLPRHTMPSVLNVPSVALPEILMDLRNPPIRALPPLPTLTVRLDLLHVTWARRPCSRILALPQLPPSLRWSVSVSRKSAPSDTPSVVI